MPKKSITQSTGGMGTFVTAAFPSVFTQSQKQASTLLADAGHRARGSGCKAGPPSPLD